MGLWNFIKGHDDLMSEIRNTSDESIVVYRHPNEDFNTKSHLFLNESEVALFVSTDKDGMTQTQILNKSGTLDTQNLPFFRSITKPFTGGQTMFHCKVYFVRTNVCVSNGWGTEAALGPLEDCRHYTFKLVANGTYDFQVTSAKILLDNILGYGVTSVTQDELAKKLNPKISNLVSIVLSGVFKIPEAAATLPRIQSSFRSESRETLGRLMNEEYSGTWGVEFSDFTMNVEDIYDGLAEHYLENNRMIQKTEAFDSQGEAYSTIQLYDMLKAAAENPGSMAGSMMGVGVGAGVGVGLGNSIGASVGSSIMTSAIGGGQPDMKPPVSKTGDRNWAGTLESEKKRIERHNRLDELKGYLDGGKIDKETYDRFVNEILKELCAP